MKRMKKLMAGVLAAVMALSLAVPAFASQEVDNDLVPLISPTPEDGTGTGTGTASGKVRYEGSLPLDVKQVVLPTTGSDNYFNMYLDPNQLIVATEAGRFQKAAGYYDKSIKDYKVADDFTGNGLVYFQNIKTDGLQKSSTVGTTYADANLQEWKKTDTVYFMDKGVYDVTLNDSNKITKIAFTTDSALTNIDTAANLANEAAPSGYGKWTVDTTKNTTDVALAAYKAATKLSTEAADVGYLDTTDYKFYTTADGTTEVSGVSGTGSAQAASETAITAAGYYATGIAPTTGTRVQYAKPDMTNDVQYVYLAATVTQIQGGSKTKIADNVIEDADGLTSPAATHALNGLTAMPEDSTNSFPQTTQTSGIYKNTASGYVWDKANTADYGSKFEKVSCDNLIYFVPKANGDNTVAGADGPKFVDDQGDALSSTNKDPWGNEGFAGDTDSAVIKAAETAGYAPSMENKAVYSDTSKKLKVINKGTEDIGITMSATVKKASKDFDLVKAADLATASDEKATMALSLVSGSTTVPVVDPSKDALGDVIYDAPKLTVKKGAAVTKLADLKSLVKSVNFTFGSDLATSVYKTVSTAFSANSKINISYTYALEEGATTTDAVADSFTFATTGFSGITMTPSADGGIVTGDGGDATITYTIAVGEVSEAATLTIVVSGAAARKLFPLTSSTDPGATKAIAEINCTPADEDSHAEISLAVPAVDAAYEDKWDPNKGTNGAYVKDMKEAYAEDETAFEYAEFYLTANINASDAWSKIQTEDRNGWGNTGITLDMTWSIHEYDEDIDGELPEAQDPTITVTKGAVNATDTVELTVFYGSGEKKMNKITEFNYTKAEGGAATPTKPGTTLIISTTDKTVVKIKSASAIFNGSGWSLKFTDMDGKNTKDVSFNLKAES